MKGPVTGWRSLLIRAVLFVVFLFVLLNLLLSAGTINHDPNMNSYPNEEEFARNPETYVGERVSASGIVASTSPVVINLTYGGGETKQITVTNAETKVAEGQNFRVFGTLRDDETINATRGHSRSLWEIRYMYLISLIGVVWVVGRGLRHWTVDLSKRGIVPRDDNA